MPFGPPYNEAANPRAVRVRAWLKRSGDYRYLAALSYVSRNIVTIVNTSTSQNSEEVNGRRLGLTLFPKADVLNTAHDELLGKFGIDASTLLLAA